ncbi:fibronectin type III domain-containing protein [Candidatus Gottesmanbacteria bacterium]|nr:fibronectin type III domain-containing protein [Candidatus Gottesmanbacteria bacterium]
MHLPNKIPTLLGLLLLIFGIGGSIALVETATRLNTQASVSIQPSNIQVTNITDTSVTITWTTNIPTTGAVTIQQPKQFAQDERDSDGKLKKYTSHSVPIHGLSPSFTYTLTILSNGSSFPKNDKPLKIKTAPELTAQAPNFEPSYGTIVDENNQPINGAIVYLTLDSGQTLSTLSKPSGTWLLPLSFVRTEDLSQYIPLEERITENILIRGESDLESSAITDTLNDSPVPTMTLGKSYDFRRQQANKVAQQLAQNAKPVDTNASVLGAQAVLPAAGPFTVSLTSPQESASLATQFPLIAGTGVPGKTVAVTLGLTSPFSDTTSVGADGLWKYSSREALAPGKQSVTITSTNDKGTPVALTHSFTVLKSGTQVLGDATPSATLEPTPIATATAIPTTKPLPTSGSTSPTILFIFLGIGLFLTGSISLSVLKE